MTLTNKQRWFADNYIGSGNATQSAIDAGYSKKTARSIGSENLTKPDVKKYIDERMKEITQSRIMSAQEALELLTRIANGEELETKVVGTRNGAESVDVPPDPKTKIMAAREILKRYPIKVNGSMEDALIRKAIAEAEIKEFESNRLKDEDSNDTEIIIVDKWGGNNGKE